MTNIYQSTSMFFLKPSRPLFGRVKVKRSICLLAVIILSFQPGALWVDNIVGKKAHPEPVPLETPAETIFTDQITSPGNLSNEKLSPLSPKPRGSSVVIENHSMGGSWFDDFNDETGLANYSDFQVRGSRVKMDWWDFNWNYRQEISIQDQRGGNLTDYPVKINFNLTNFNYTKADANGSDIRFVDSDENNYEYWIEKWNASGESRILLKIPNIPANGERKVRMYYGNPIAESRSNGSTVFSLFEDCSGKNLTGKLISYSFGTAENTLVPDYGGSLKSTRNRELGLDGYAVMSRDIYFPGTSISYDQMVVKNENNLFDAMDARILLVAPNYHPQAPVVENIYLSYSINFLTPVLQAGENNGDGNSLFENNSIGREWSSFRNLRLDVLDDTKVELYYKNEFQAALTLNNSLEHGFYVIFGYYNATNTGLGNGHAYKFYLDNFNIRNHVSQEPMVHLGHTEKANITTSLESVVVERPPSFYWSHLGHAKSEPKDTRLNVTILNAASGTPIPGFENISTHSADISVLNDLNISSIRLRGWFTAKGTIKPLLESWGLEWRAENAWRDSFITSTRLEDYENLTAGGSLSLAANTAIPGPNVSAAWHFDQGAGDVAADMSGNGNHGAIFGPIRSKGFYGGGLKFDGSNDLVRAGKLGIYEQLTVEMRIKPDFPANDSSQMLYRLFTGNDTTAMYNTANDSFIISHRMNDSNWKTTGELTGIGSVRALLESSDGTVYAGTTPNGDVFKSLDHGATWTNTGGLTGATNVSTLIQASGGAIFAGTVPNGKLFRTNTGGLNWVDMGTVGTQSPHSINCLMESSRGLLYAGTEGVPGEVYRSRDGGASWEATGPFPAGTLAVNSLMESSDGSIFAGTNYLGSIFRSRDGGDTWQATAYDGEPLIIHSLLETSDGVILAGGELPYKDSGARVYRSENGGGSWNMTTMGIPGHAVYSLVETYDGTIYAGTGEIVSGIVKSTDGGRTWRLCAGLGGGETYSLMESSFGHFFAATSAAGGVFGVPTNVTVSALRRFSASEWMHLAFVVDERNTTVYNDGFPCGSVSQSIRPDLTGFLIGGDMHSQESDGGYPAGMKNSSFQGIMDEMILYDRAMGPSEIMDRASTFHKNSTFRSANIFVPENNTWDVFHASRRVDNGTMLNLSIHDAATGQPLAWDNGTSGTISLDLLEINTWEHPVVYLEGFMGSNRTRTPMLIDWALNWTPEKSPKLMQDIPDLMIPEENLTKNLLNLDHHFSDPYSGIRDPIYNVTGFDDANITSEVEGKWLNVISLSVNWTGITRFKVKCTNLYGRMATSNIFNVTVFEVNDLPAWRKFPPAIVLEEDREMTTHYSLGSYVTDDEKDTLDFSVTCDDENITASLDHDHHITIIPKKDYFGNIMLNATVFEAENRSNSSSISLPVTVTPVNDPPVVTLTHPANNSILFSRDVTLSWDFIDVDDENTSFEVYLSKSDPPGFYMGSLESSKLDVRDLEDGATYYWYVVGNDGENSALSTGSTWSFIINTSAMPQVELLFPENGAAVNTTDVNLSWRVINPLPSLTYQIYFGNEKHTLEELGNSTRTWYLLTDLEDKSVYWWKVIPLAGEIPGICSSGVWNFTLDSSYEVLYNLDIHFNSDDLVIIRGRNTTLNLTLVNLGNTNIEVKLSITGPLWGHVSFNRSITVPRGGQTGVQINIHNTTKLDIGNYPLNITAAFVGGKRELNVNILLTDEVVGSDDDDIDDKDDEDKRGGGGLEWLWIGGGIFILILLVVLIFLFHRRKSRSGSVPEKGDGAGEDPDPEDREDGEEEVLEPEIEYIPSHGIANDVMEDRSEIELEPNGIHYGYTRKSESRGPVVVAPDHLSEKGGSGTLKGGVTRIRAKMPSNEEGELVGRIEDGAAEHMEILTSTENAEVNKGRVAPAEKSVSCSICFGIVKTGLPLVTCSCGKKYHLACFERVGECPNCGIGFTEIESNEEEISSKDISSDIHRDENSGSDNYVTVPEAEEGNANGKVPWDCTRKTEKAIGGKDGPVEGKIPVQEVGETETADDDYDDEDFHIEL